MLHVITQSTKNFDHNKGLTPKRIKATSIWHLNSQSSQDLESI
jgi:hypothetical protein